MSAAQGDLYVQRWAPKQFEIPFEGFDFTGQTLTMQVRLYRDAPGDPIINLTGAASPAEGLSVVVATDEGLTTSTVHIRINETTIEGVLPFPASGVEQGDSVTLAYALHVGTGAAKRRMLEGAFIIEPGANQA